MFLEIFVEVSFLFSSFYILVSALGMKILKS